VLLSDLVATSDAVARSPGRKAKVGLIAALLARVPPAEVPAAVAFLSGELTQGQIGVGYATLSGLTGAVQPGDAEAAHGPGSPVLTLTAVDATFGRIAAMIGPGSQAQRHDLLAAMLGRATPSERQFLIRLMAGDLRQGALEGVMAEAVAQAAGVPAGQLRRAHQVRGSLPEVARAALAAAAGGGRPGDAALAALAAFTLTVGRPVRPMLAASAPSLDAALARISPAALEWKIDGIRVQVHRDGTDVRVFTRACDEITDRVPELVAIGLSLRASSAVVDGEAIALQPDGRPRPFQVTSARVATSRRPGAGGRNAGPAGRVPLTAFLFDVLYADGRDLTGEPARRRFAVLEAIAPPGLVIPRLVTADPARAGAFFREALARGHEGVVVKSVTAPYRAGRRGGDWIKVKPRVTLDLVVLAAEWGHGRRRGLLSNLHLGARDPGGGFIMLGKTFKGLSDAVLAWQTERLLAIADPPARGPWTAGGQGMPEGQGMPAGRGLPGGPGDEPGEGEARAWPRGVVRVRPELVVEVAFDGIQASRRYPGGVTLRFARVLRYRTDKQAGEADTIDAVRALWAGGAGDPS